MHPYTHIHMDTYYRCTHTHIYICSHTHIHMHPYTYICTHTYTYIHTRILRYYVHIHTYKHTLWCILIYDMHHTLYLNILFGNITNWCCFLNRDITDVFVSPGDRLAYFCTDGNILAESEDGTLGTTKTTISSITTGDNVDVINSRVYPARVALYIILCIISSFHPIILSSYHSIIITSYHSIII